MESKGKNKNMYYVRIEKLIRQYNEKEARELVSKSLIM